METTELAPVSTDQLETTLVDLEAQIGARRHLQMRLLVELDLRQVPLADGSRNLAEWAASRLDLAPETAQKVTRTARRLSDQPQLAQELATGGVSFDRAVEESHLVASDADHELVESSRGFDLVGVRRLAARHRRITRQTEQQIFSGRSFSMQPNLDHSYARFWGGLPGLEAHQVELALQTRADQFPTLPNGEQRSRSQRLADALVAISQDSLDGTHPDTASSTGLVSIFVDASLAAQTDGEAGAETDQGIRVGPLTLEQILCDGQVEILATNPEGKPLTVGTTSRTIPPKLRRFILHRDGGACTVDGCRSRYRLQPHHITPKSQGGTHHPDNLTTLCWYHHHVVIHRNGYQIDANTPPQRRRFLKLHKRGPP